MQRALAVILGGGAGTRLFPLTGHRAKPAVPLAGKYRLVDVPISNCINSGLDRIFVVTQYNSASLNKHIARAYNFDRFRAGFVTVLAAEQTPSSETWFQGTADAVRQSLLHMRSYPHDRVVILSGDQLYAQDYRQMLEHHEALGADITIGVTPVVAADAPGFGILKTDAEQRITEFHEKPKLPELGGKESPWRPSSRRRGRSTWRRWASTCSTRACSSGCSPSGRTSTTSARRSSRAPSAAGRAWWRTRSPATGTTSARCARSSRRT
jgi:glucose-1-phosphate adenylyltransferase